MPNLFAYAVLTVWPLVAIWLFRTLPKPEAATWSVVASFLFLPMATQYDLPLIPPLDKVSLPNLTLLLLAITTPGRRFRLLPESRVPVLLLLVLVIGSFATAIANSDPYVEGLAFRPGLTVYDAVSETIRTAITIIPFLIGRSLLGDPAGHRIILRTLFAAGVFYAFLMLVEIRLSPQLHVWIYGFFQHDFLQMVREGGFRPIVFLPHGLWVAFYAMTITIAAAILWRAAPRERRGPYFAAFIAFFVVLALCRSLGSLIFGVMLAPLVLLAGGRTQVRVAAGLAIVAILYPALRGAGLIPVQSILDFAQSVSAERAASFLTRVWHEEALLARASERPWLGWGGWGRNLVYEPETGLTLSITDGFWVIVIGVSGWIGYVAIFGLLGWPLIAIWRRARIPPSPETAGLCLLLGVNMIELLPNSTLPPWSWLIAGALLGHAERLRDRGAENAVADAAGNGGGASRIATPPPIRTEI